jgi:2-aminoadipate transaminase
MNSDSQRQPDKTHYWQQHLAVDIANTHAPNLPYYTPDNSISLHLGYPDPLGFPHQAIAEAIVKVINEDHEKALQYCGEQGDILLRKTVAAMYQHLPRVIDETNVLITQGTTDALEILPQMMLSKGDIVLMEAPTYLWAIRSFKFRRARMIGIPTDSDGICTDLLKSRLTELVRHNLHPKFLYVMPDFQNPSGQTMTFERRKELLDIAAEFDLLVVEDNPYIELRYEGNRLPTLFEIDKHDLVILAQSVSKTIGPGIRLGWIVGPSSFISKLVKLKQTGACTLLSRAVSRYVQTTDYEQNLEKARGIYRAKCEAMARALEESCPKDIKWNVPQGGFYFWLTLPQRVKLSALYENAQRKRVVFLSGHDFFCDETRWNSLRLSFSYESETKIFEGVSVLGKLLE